MASPVSTFTTRVAYGARQLPRVAWYVGHGMLMRRLSEEARQREGEGARPRARASGPVPEQRRLYADMAALFQRDLANVEAGIYPLPADHDGSCRACSSARACSSRTCRRSIAAASRRAAASAER